MKQLSEKKNLILKLSVCAIAVLFATIMLILYLTVIKDKPVIGQKNVSLIIKYQNKTYEYENLPTEELYVLDFLIEYNETLELKLEYDTSAFGSLITSLKSTAQDTQNGYYYTYTINGEYADGVETQTIKDGDLISFDYAFEVWEQNNDGEWVKTDTVYQSGGDNSLSSLPKEYDVMLISLVLLISLLVVASIIYLSITLKKQSPKRKDNV